jgi:endonuclease YncB( thermonuclease family)
MKAATSIFFILSTACFAGSFTGKVVGVHDGDTITVLDAQKVQHKIRLAGIDTPELKQAHGKDAKKALSLKVFSKHVRIEWTTKDRYKRTIGRVYLGKRDINLEMVQEGWAWHYKHYSKEKALADAEKGARAAKKGLWRSQSPVAPWNWRRGARKPSAGVIGGSKAIAGEYWLNTKSNVRHNSRCRYYKKTKSGRACKANTGRPCGLCGG